MVLGRVVDHFNIQVDNPLTVLTQDQARGFLANSTPKDKYVVRHALLTQRGTPLTISPSQFFLRGTQLAQLTEEYEVIRTNMEHMSVTLDRKKAVVPELKEAYKKAKEKATEAKAAVNQKEKVEELKNELAWAYVEEIETVSTSARQGGIWGLMRFWDRRKSAVGRSWWPRSSVLDPRSRLRWTSTRCVACLTHPRIEWILTTTLIAGQEEGG